MDISTLSKQLNMSAQQLRFKIREAGFFVSPRANKIDNLLAKQILNALTQNKVPEAVPGKLKDITLPKVLSVKELAAKLGLDVTVVIKKLIMSGVMATINEEIDYDTAAIVATDLGFNVSATHESRTRPGLGYVTEPINKKAAKKPEHARLK